MNKRQEDRIVAVCAVVSFIVLVVGVLVMPTIAKAGVMGFNEEALLFSGAPDWAIEDHMCSAWHNNNDELNQLCHIGIADTARAVAEDHDFSKIEAHVAALLVLYGWELTNKNFDWLDIFTAPIKVHDDFDVSLGIKRFGIHAIKIKYSVDF